MPTLITDEELLQLNLQEIFDKHTTFTKENTKICIEGGKICCEFNLNKEALDQDIFNALNEYNSYHFNENNNF